MRAFFSDLVETASSLPSRSASLEHARSQIVRRLPQWARTYVAARETRPSDSLTTRDTDPIFYVDAGYWGGGPDGNAMTTFVLISGSDLLICSWMNLCENCRHSLASLRQGNDSVVQYGSENVTLTPGLNRFISRLAGQFGSGSRRGYLAAAAHMTRGGSSAGTGFSDPDLVTVVLPDLHLHLYQGQAFDRFRYGSSLNSLDQELRSLIDFCNQDRQVITAQAGDMYEIWEAEDLLRWQYYGLLTNRGGTPQPHRSDQTYMLQNGIVLPINLTTTWEQWTRQDQPTAMTADEMNAQCVNFRSTNAIKAAIRRAHAPLFGQATRLINNEVPGNHDNHLANDWWRTDAAPSDYRQARSSPIGQQANTYLRSATEGGSRGVNFYRSGRTWIEHGHRFDHHNNDNDWARPGRGFDITHNYSAGTIGDVLGTRGGGGAGNLARQAADLWQDLRDQEMRLPSLVCADIIFYAHADVSLVVVAHTHTPCLREDRRGTFSLVRRHPHGERYLRWYIEQRERE